MNNNQITSRRFPRAERFLDKLYISANLESELKALSTERRAELVHSLTKLNGPEISKLNAISNIGHGNEQNFDFIRSIKVNQKWIEEFIDAPSANRPEQFNKVVMESAALANKGAVTGATNALKIFSIGGVAGATTVIAGAAPIIGAYETTGLIAYASHTGLGKFIGGKAYELIKEKGIDKTSEFIDSRIQNSEKLNQAAHIALGATNLAASVYVADPLAKSFKSPDFIERAAEFSKHSGYEQLGEGLSTISKAKENIVTVKDELLPEAKKAINTVAIREASQQRDSLLLLHALHPHNPQIQSGAMAAYANTNSGGLNTNERMDRLQMRGQILKDKGIHRGEVYLTLGMNDATFDKYINAGKKEQWLLLSKSPPTAGESRAAGAAAFEDIKVNRGLALKVDTLVATAQAVGSGKELLKAGADKLSEWQATAGKKLDAAGNWIDQSWKSMKHWALDSPEKDSPEKKASDKGSLADVKSKPSALSPSNTPTAPTQPYQNFNQDLQIYRERQQRYEQLNPHVTNGRNGSFGVEFGGVCTVDDMRARFNKANPLKFGDDPRAEEIYVKQAHDKRMADLDKRANDKGLCQHDRDRAGAIAGFERADYALRCNTSSDPAVRASQQRDREAALGRLAKVDEKMGGPSKAVDFEARKEWITSDKRVRYTDQWEREKQDFIEARDAMRADKSQTQDPLSPQNQRRLSAQSKQELAALTPDERSQPKAGEGASEPKKGNDHQPAVAGSGAGAGAGAGAQPAVTGAGAQPGAAAAQTVKGEDKPVTVLNLEQVTQRVATMREGRNGGNQGGSEKTPVTDKEKVAPQVQAAPKAAAEQGPRSADELRQSLGASQNEKGLEGAQPSQPMRVGEGGTSPALPTQPTLPARIEKTGEPAQAATDSPPVDVRLQQKDVSETVVRQEKKTLETPQPVGTPAQAPSNAQPMQDKPALEVGFASGAGATGKTTEKTQPDPVANPRPNQPVVSSAASDLKAAPVFEGKVGQATPAAPMPPPPGQPRGPAATNPAPVQGIQANGAQATPGGPMPPPPGQARNAAPSSTTPGPAVEGKVGQATPGGPMPPPPGQARPPTPASASPASTPPVQGVVGQATPAGGVRPPPKPPGGGMDI